MLLLDHFMEKHSIMEYRLKLVALTCLLVAAKMEDRDDYLPTIGQLQSLAKVENLAEYSRDNFQRMELYLMKYVSRGAFFFCICLLNALTVRVSHVHAHKLSPKTEWVWL